MSGWRSQPRENRDSHDRDRDSGHSSSSFKNWRSSRGNDSHRGATSMNWRNRDQVPEARHATDRNAEQPQAAQEGGASATGNRLFVGNLLYTANPGDITKVFEDNGFVVAEINMSVDPMTGRNPSYCFVEMDSKEAATEAMEALNGTDVMGRPLKIKPAFPKESGGVSHGRLKSSGRNWRDINGADGGYRATFDRYSRNDSEQHWDAPLQEGRRLFVGGLPRIQPQSAVDEAMQELFDGFQLDVVSKLIVPRDQDQSKDSHYLFVDLIRTEDVAACIEKLHGIDSPWGKGRLTVSKARDNRDRKVMREQDVPLSEH